VESHIQTGNFLLRSARRSDVAVEASLALGREVNLVVLTTSQLSRNLAARRAFYENVVAGPKLWVLGDPARLASIPPARVRKTAPTA
jgi:hypothetical protein